MLAILLLATLTGDVAPADPAPVRVIHDLSDFASPPGENRALHVTPFPMVPEESWPELSDEAFHDVADVVAELLQGCVAVDAMQMAECSIGVEEGSRLVVDGPEAAQHDVAAVVGLLRSGLSRQAVVTVELLRVKDAGAVDPSAIESDLQSGRMQRVLFRTETLSVGRTAECTAETHRRLVVDSEPEIAQRSAIMQPRMLELVTGFRAMLRVEDAGGGRFALRFAARVAEVRGLPTRQEGLQIAITGDAGVTRTPALSSFERPDVPFATLAASGRVAAGQVLVAAAGSQTANGPVGWVLRVGLANAAAAPAPLACADGAHSVALFDVSRLIWPGVQAQRPRPLDMAPDHIYPHDVYNNWEPWLYFPDAEPRGMDAVANAIEGACAEAGESVWCMTRGNWMLACASPTAMALVEQELAATEPKLPDLVLSLQASVRGPDGKLQPEASLRLPLRPLDTGLAWCGAEGLTTTSYDVDVAEAAACADPSVNGFVDGLALRARPTAGGGVRVELLLSRVLAWERVALNAPGLESYERPAWGVVELARDFLPGSPVRLEGLGDPFSALGSLALEIAVAAR